MKVVAITQRVDISLHHERRDGLDQRWHPFLAHCGLTALSMPNNAQAAAALNAVEACGLILSGGNDLARFSGDAPERDATERMLVELFVDAGKPVLGVCRGMQFLADYYGSTLGRVENHAGTRHAVRFEDGTGREVNSYHHYSVLSLGSGLKADAVAEDGTIEAMHHEHKRVCGMMWHPEREATPHSEDIRFFQQVFTS